MQCIVHLQFYLLCTPACTPRCRVDGGVIFSAHCQILHDITGIKEALVAAQKDGLIDFYNQLTSAGRNIGYMMLADVEEYEKLFDVEVKKTPDFFDQQATHQLQL